MHTKYSQHKTPMGIPTKPINGLICHKLWLCTRQLTTKAPVIYTNEFSTLKQSYNPTKYPIVLCHGLSGLDSLIFLPKPNYWRKTTVRKVIREGLIKVDYWYGIQDTLTSLGCEVHTGRVPPFGKIQDRANTLHEYLEKEFDQRTKVNIIAHSMGGLDARYLVSQFEGNNYEVASLTTVSTPHHGSEVADFVMDYVKPGVILPQAVSELTTKRLQEFNEVILDDANVAYFSYGARFHPRWFNVFRSPWNIINRRISYENERRGGGDGGGLLNDNDGLVSVESAKWGEYLGTLDQVDHLDLINWTNTFRTVVDRVMFAHKPTFNALAFYCHIINNLSNRGF